METHDHKSPIFAGNDGHGGVYACRKCGWPFPNHHPSSKQRRAHKRVCGTVEGYRLDTDAGDKARVDGDVAEINSDDDLKTPSKKVVEKSISRKSSSGIGSKSGQSTRSEEDVFTDADTEFNESSSTVTGEMSDGIQRYYSIQNGNDLDYTEPAVEISADKLPTLQRVDDEHDNLGAVVRSQDPISTSPLVSADVVFTSESTVDQKPIQSSEPSRDLDIVSERSKEIISSKGESDIRISVDAPPKEVTEEVSIPKVDSDEVKGVSNEFVDSISAGGLMDTLMETDRFNDVDVPENDEIESRNDINSSGTFSSSALQSQGVDSGNSNITKPELIQECDLKIGAIENLDPNAGKLKLSEVIDSPCGSVEYSKASALDEGGSVSNFTQTGAKDRLFSADVDVCSMAEKQASSKISIDEHNAIQEPGQMSDANLCNVDTNIVRPEAGTDLNSINSDDEKVICANEKKPITSQENILSEDFTMDAGLLQETISTRDFNVKDDGDRFTDLANESSKFSKNGFAAGHVDSTTVEADIFNEKGTSVGVVDNGSTERDRDADCNVVNRTSESGDILIADDHLNSQRGGEIERTGENARKEECMDDNVTDAILITNDHLISTSKLEVDEDAEYSCQSSAAVNYNSIGKFTEESSCTTEYDGIIDQHVTTPAIDSIVDSGSQADSLDGNWGSVSVISAISDAQPTTDNIASNHPLALEGEESQVMVLKPVINNQPSEKQISVKTEVSEIQTSKEDQLINSTDVANEPEQGSKDNEIIAKVANWDSGNQRTPLKTLLGEAIARSRAESPVHHSQSSTSTSIPVPQTSVIPGTNNGFSEKTENVVLKSDHHETKADQEEMGIEWDSPAKYPVKIKSEKRKSKSKPYWSPFLCCSSVNAR